MSEQPVQYSVEWFRWMYLNNPKWLGTQALKLWEHYAVLEAKLDELAMILANSEIAQHRTEAKLEATKKTLKAADDVFDFVSGDAEAYCADYYAAYKELRTATQQERIADAGPK